MSEAWRPANPTEVFLGFPQSQAMVIAETVRQIRRQSLLSKYFLIHHSLTPIIRHYIAWATHFIKWIRWHSLNVPLFISIYTNNILSLRRLQYRRFADKPSAVSLYCARGMLLACDWSRVKYWSNEPCVMLYNMWTETALRLLVAALRTVVPEAPGMCERQVSYFLIRFLLGLRGVWLYWANGRKTIQNRRVYR
jgi:hypothetical protein